MSGKHEAERLLADLLTAGAIPALEAGRLRIEAPLGVLDQERRDALRGCLPELRAIVHTRYRSREECVAKRPCRRMSVCQAPEQDGWSCLLPRVCAVCKTTLPTNRRYLCQACAEPSMTTNRKETE